jgi:hypothetical protein
MISSHIFILKKLFQEVRKMSKGGNTVLSSFGQFLRILITAVFLPGFLPAPVLAVPEAKQALPSKNDDWLIFINIVIAGIIIIGSVYWRTAYR